MKVWIRRAFLALVALVVIGGLVYAFWPRPIAVDLAAVTRGPLTVHVEQEGMTRIRDRYIVSAPLTGRVRRILVDPGDQVAAGQTLLTTLEPVEPALLDARAIAEAEARVRVARAALQRAGPEIERARAAVEFAAAETRYTRVAFERGAATPREVDLAILEEQQRRAELRSAEVSAEVLAFELELAEAALMRTRPADGASAAEPFEIHSPVDGRVLRVLQEGAVVVSPGTPLVELGDPRDLEVVIDVLSSDAVRIRRGAAVLLERWGGEQPLRAVVRVVEPSAFTKISALGVEEQRVNVVADFLSPIEERDALGHGYRVEAAIEIWSRDDALRVPAAALFRHGRDWAVFIHQAGRAELQVVQIGQRTPILAEVVGGLQEGQEVIVYPSDLVADGVAIVPRDTGAERRPDSGSP